MGLSICKHHGYLSHVPNLPTQWMPQSSEERPAGNTVPILIVSAPTVNNVTDAIVCAPTDVNNVADENECVTVSEINDGAQCHA